MIRLGVNIDHVATVRQARRASEPDPVAAAVLATLGGADGITVHLREDRRHIQDRDVHLLRETVTTRLNLEMAAYDEIIAVALKVKPDEVTLVPEKRQELTTEGGLDVAANIASVRGAVDRLKPAGMHISLFIDPDPAQVDASARLGADAIEFQTASYSEARGADVERELEKLRAATARA
ncbi:MAG: pyridoxine 5'-phosphate synthase, partial [Gemmata sp.]